MKSNAPVALNLHKASKEISIQYGVSEVYRLKAEYLRIYSPSAEVRGHGKPTLQIGKLYVGIVGIEPVGRYALKIIFDDGHDSGIYSWDYLYDLCVNSDARWDSYLKEVRSAGVSRDPNVLIVKIL